MTHQFTVGDTVRHSGNARTATIRAYVDINMYEIQYDDHHTWATVASTEITPHPAPIYSATSADVITGMTVGAPAAGVSVPVGQCIELINAAVAYRSAQRAHRAAWMADGDGYTDADEDRISEAHDQARKHLHAVIDALPEPQESTEQRTPDPDGNHIFRRGVCLECGVREVQP